jgi:hypothetical protein
MEQESPSKFVHMVTPKRQRPNLWCRFVSPTPSFWRRVQAWGMILTAGAAVIVAHPDIVHPVITSLASHTMVFGIALSAAGQAAIKHDIW